MSAKVLNLFQTSRKCDWADQEIAEFHRVANALAQAGFGVVTDRGVTDEGDPWFIFIREKTEEVIAHFARIDGVFIADAGMMDAPVSGRDLRAVLSQVFRTYTLVAPQNPGSNLFLHPAALLAAFVATAFLELQHGSQRAAAALPESAESPGDGNALKGFLNKLLNAAAARGEGSEGRVEASEKAAAQKPAAPNGPGQPGNTAGRAVSFSDSGAATEHGLTSSVMITAMFAALSTLQGMDAAAAQESSESETATDDESGTTGLDDKAHLFRTTLEIRHGRDGFDFNGDGSGQGDIQDRLALFGETGGPRNAETPDQETLESDSFIAATESLTGAHRAKAADPIPAQPFDFDSNGWAKKAAALVLEANARRDQNDPDGENSQADLADFLYAGMDGETETVKVGGTSLYISGLAAIFDQIDRSWITQLRDGDIPETASLQFSDLLDSESNMENEALLSIIDYVKAGTEKPTRLTNVEDSFLANVSNAFTEDDGTRPDLVLFESVETNIGGFQFLPGVIFVNNDIIDEGTHDFKEPEHITDLEDGAHLKLLGIVTVADPSADLGG